MVILEVGSARQISEERETPSSTPLSQLTRLDSRSISVCHFALPIRQQKGRKDVGRGKEEGGGDKEKKMVGGEAL